MTRTAITKSTRPSRHGMLGIYLNDHLAGATAGSELARRMARSHQEREEAAILKRLAAEIARDRTALLDIMTALGIPVRAYKVGVAWIGEKAGRLKFNGRILSRSPVSDLEELELLRLGVEGKAAGWRTLRTLAGTDVRLDAERLDELISRASSQADQLEELRLHAANRIISQLLPGPFCCGGRCRRSGWWRTRTTARTALAPPQPEGRSWPCGGSARRCSGPAAGSRPVPPAGCADRRTSSSTPCSRPGSWPGWQRARSADDLWCAAAHGRPPRRCSRTAASMPARTPAAAAARTAWPGRGTRSSRDLPSGRRLRPRLRPPRWSVHTSSTRRSPGHDASDLPHQLACGVPYPVPRR